MHAHVHVHAHLVEAELWLEDPDAVRLLVRVRVGVRVRVWVRVTAWGSRCGGPHLSRALLVELDVVLTKPPRRGLQRPALPPHLVGVRVGVRLGLEVGVELGLGEGVGVRGQG